MKVTLEDLSTVKKTLHIEIPEEDVAKELDDAYKQLKKTAKIKGFRPGKAPRSVLERLFKKDVHADILSRLLQSSFIEALQENNLNPIGSPKIDPPELKPGEPYRYDATIEIQPEIADIDFKGLELKKTLYEVSDGELEGQLKVLQKNLAQKKPIDEERPVKKGDFVIIDYEGFKDGEPFSETEKTENYTMEVGKGTIAKEIDEKLLGMSAGEETDAPVSFPVDYFNKELAGVEIVFKVKLHEIREEILPEIDDEFAKRLGKFETVEELKKEMIDNLEQGYEKRVEHEMNEQIFTALIDKTEFEVPDTLIDMELEGIVREAEKSFSMQGISLEEAGISKESIAEKHRGTAEKQVRRHLILNKIVKQEELTLSEEDLEKGIADMAEASRQPVETIKQYYDSNKEGLDFFKHTLLEKQAIGLIIEQGNVEEIAPESTEAS